MNHNFKLFDVSRIFMVPMKQELNLVLQNFIALFNRKYIEHLNNLNFY